jgi:hypothetical protein
LLAVAELAEGMVAPVWGAGATTRERGTEISSKQGHQVASGHIPHRHKLCNCRRPSCDHTRFLGLTEKNGSYSMCPY